MKLAGSEPKDSPGRDSTSPVADEVPAGYAKRDCTSDLGDHAFDATRREPFVSTEECEITALRACDAVVRGPGLASMRGPHEARRNTEIGKPSRQQRRRFVGRCVIDDNDLEVPVGLRRDRIEGALDGARVIAGG